ncbi:hypothetical protein [Legionella fairfieldensis]|uniref:hypothetical protein n=1 Tax=Legionella fairfieldensis TaxID=45064 RepID=UPI00048C147B|nr:hypothetical protein [Legionella fairfieldensis]
MNKWDLMLQEELKKQPINLYRFVEQCCSGFSVSAQQVIDHLLSLEDEQDIINSEIPIESLKLHIEVWIKAGKPHYSGKQIG